MRSGHLSSYLLLGCVIFSAIVGCSDPFPEVEDAVDEYWLASFDGEQRQRSNLCLGMCNGGVGPKLLTVTHLIDGTRFTSVS